MLITSQLIVLVVKVVSVAIIAVYFITEYCKHSFQIAILCMGIITITECKHSILCV